MGLDQYIYRVRKFEGQKNFYPAPVDCVEESEYLPSTIIEDSHGDNSRVAYWRKNYYINDFMKEFAKSRYTEFDAETFNCSFVQLPINVIVRLINKIATEENYEYDKEYDIQQLARAVVAIDEGYSVYYSPWW